MTDARRAKRVAAISVAVLGLVAAGCGTSDSGSSGSTGSTGGTTSSSTAGTIVAGRPSFADDLQPLIETAMQENAIPGAVIHIESGGEGVWSETFGTSTIGEDDPPALDDYFRVGSNTKTMTSTVILQLAEEGMLSLDDPVSKY